MISYQIIEHGRPLQKVMHDTPKPPGTEVLVRITNSGVCHLYALRAAEVEPT